MQGPYASASVASFDGVHLKLNRASEHGDAFKAEAREFLRRPDTCEIRAEDDAQRGETVFRVTRQPTRPPARLAVIAGDAIHNMRAALDYVVWQLVIANGQKPRAGAGGNSFPF